MLQGLFSAASQRPVKAVDSTAIETTLRGNGYGESYCQPASPDGLDVCLGEGSYFTGALAASTPGAGFVTGATQVGFSDTSAFLLLKNNAPLNSNINIRPDTLKLIVNGVGAAITSLHLAAVLDDASRWGNNPGGSLLAFAANGSGPLQSNSQAVAGGLGPQAATGNKKLVGRCVLKAAAPVLNDEFIIRFSNAAQPSGSIAAANAATVVRHMEPVIIPPGKMLILHAWWPAGTTGPNLEPYLTVIER
jgi:hypothetical protein